MRLLGFILLYLISTCSNAQKIDSLLHELADHKTDNTVKAATLIELAHIYREQDNDKSIEYANQAITLTSTLKNDSLLALALYEKSNALESNGEYLKAQEVAFECLEKYNALGHRQKIAEVKNVIALLYYYQNNLGKSKQYWEEALLLFEQNKDMDNAALLLCNLGALYELDNDFDEADKAYQKSLAIRQTLKDSLGIADIYMNLGTLHYAQQELDKNNLKIAEKFYQKGIEVYKQVNHVQGIASGQLNLSSLEEIKGNYALAIEYAKEAIEGYELIGDNYLILYANNELLDYYENSGQLNEAIELSHEIIAMKDSMFNLESTSKIAEMETKYQTAEKEKQLKIQQLELDKNQAELERHELLEYALAGGIVLLLALGFQTVIRSREKSRSNELLTTQKQEIELKNFEILDSIQYAKRIQNAILPPDELIKQHLPKSFTLYLPKDIVSGDFYWMHHEREPLLFATVDCTGHGVPGAFMSIVGYNMLNKMVNELKLSQPAEILTNLNKYVAESLHQEQNADVKDGMDMSLCALDLKNKTLQYAGANNPLYIIRNNKVIETKGDKKAIGSYYFRDDKLFTNHEIQLQEGDTVYIFTDGFADQFGGEKEKKYMYKRFKNILIETSKLPIEQQEQKLLNEFYEWKGNLEQVDDICIVGVQI